MRNAEYLLAELVKALDNAFISSWQSTEAWQKQLDEAREFLRTTAQDGPAAMSDEDIELSPLPREKTLSSETLTNELGVVPMNELTQSAAGLDVEDVLRLFLTGDGFIAECDIPHIVATLAAQKADDARDAERYRWLRKGNIDDIAVVRGLGAMDYGMSGVAHTYSEEIDGVDLDFAIDAAMSKAREG